MTKEKLDSDRLNYLIWRYLVESDYRETAVKLQKEWNIEDPQKLPFAQHVNINALVRVTNRGLLYDESEREEKAQNVATPLSGCFGPLMPESPVADEEFDNIRKRQNDDEIARLLSSGTNITTSNGPANKKPRLSNGTAVYENNNGFDSNAMDVDDEMNNGDENAYPSPEQAETPIITTTTTITTGPTTGTQVDKVHELNSETTFLDLSDDPARNANTVLLQCEFNPRDPTLLAAAGTDALARMWTLSRASAAHDPAAAPESPRKPKFAAHHNLLEENMPSSTTTTGLSWSADGTTIAVSSEPNDDGVAKVEFWNTDGIQLASYNTFESPIICLKWNTDNTACLTISPGNEGRSTVITVMQPSATDSIMYQLPNHSLSEQILDVAWTAPDVFVVCGGDMLKAYQITDNVINPVKKFETKDGSALSKVVFDRRTELLATASDVGTIDIWNVGGHCHSFNAHTSQITALAWQPFDENSMVDHTTERLLASGGEDGAISIWNAHSAESKPKYAMTMQSSIIGLAFTPDGAYLAGATNEQILIWKTDDVNIPCCSWSRADDVGWRTPQTQDSANDEDQFSLCWDAKGQQLAYAVNSKLAVIQFQP